MMLNVACPILGTANLPVPDRQENKMSSPGSMGLSALLGTELGRTNPKPLTWAQVQIQGILFKLKKNLFTLRAAKHQYKFPRAVDDSLLGSIQNTAGQDCG